MSHRDRHYRHIGWSFGAFFASVVIGLFTTAAVVLIGLAAMFLGVAISGAICPICNPENKED